MTEERDTTARAAAALDDPDVRREAPAARAVDPLREALADMARCDEWACFSFDEVQSRARAALAAAPQAATVDPLRAALVEATAGLIAIQKFLEHGERIDGDVVLRWCNAATAALAAAPQPAPVDRETLVDLITDAELRWQSKGPHTGPTKSLAIADALLAAGLRLAIVVCHETPVGDTQAPLSITDDMQTPAETLAWGAVNKDGAIQPDLISKDRVVTEGLAKDYAERVVRVAIRIVEDEA